MCSTPKNKKTAGIRTSAFVAGALGSLLMSAASFGQTSGDFHPVVITTATGEHDQESRRLLVENYSDVVRASALKSLGREFYGTSAKDGFAGVGSKGPIGLLRKTLITMDKDMADRVSRIFQQLKPPTTDTAVDRMELFWTQRDLGSSVLGKQSDSMALLLKILGPSVRSNNQTTNPFALELGRKAMNLQIATSDQVAGGRNGVVAEAKDAYASLRELNQNAWVPLHVDSLVMMDKEKNITTKLAVTMIPVGFNFEKERVGDFSIERTTYRTELDNRSVIRIFFQRTYGANNSNRPPLLVKVNFGPLKADSTEADVCVGDGCLRKVDSVPTIHAVIDGGWLKNAFSKVLSLNKIQILIASLGINIENLSVDPGTSELPMLLKTYTFGTKVVDLRRNSRPYNPLEAIQKTLVGNQVSAGLSERLAAEGENAEKKINESLQSVVDLFR